VFLILMENSNWSDIAGSSSAPYINNTLLALGAHALDYHGAKHGSTPVHPSEPNYLWLEAGDNFGITDDSNPSSNHQSTTAHLVTQLQAAGVSWKSYQEDITGTTCPLTGHLKYATKHNPMVFFDDVTNSQSASSANCIAHVRPFTELKTDLQAGTAARYNFLTPNLCNDMHDSCAPQNNRIKQGDDWLAANVPYILSSAAFQQGGLLLITWDESEPGATADFPIGMIAISSKAKAGYASNVYLSHSSTLRSVQTIFGVSPYLGAAANAADLGDLFTQFP
jgi:hypothetical protein